MINELREFVRARVAAGFDGRDDIIQAAVEYLGDEHPADELEPMARAETDAAFREQSIAQHGWPAITDCDRIDRAFAKLAADGVLSRQNFACCQSCGHAEIGDERAEGQPSIGYAFYHAQDTERVVETGVLYLAYGAWDGHTSSSIAIGRMILEALRQEGLATEWDGSIEQRIAVTGLDWKRRRATTG